MKDKTLSNNYVSSKLYDILTTESLQSLPFNCDGCVRVVPKFKELVLIITNQHEKIEDFGLKFKA